MSAFSLRPHMSWTLKQEPWCLFLFFISFFLLIFLGPQPRHMEVPVLGVESGCRWSAYIHHNHINTTSKPHLSPTHGSGKHQILNPLSKARDQTSVLMDTSRPCYHWATTGTRQVVGFELWVFPTPVCSDLLLFSIRLSYSFDKSLLADLLSN